MSLNILNFLSHIFPHINYGTVISTVLASSVFTAAINSFFSWKNNKDSIKADINAKSRIEWIQDVKKCASKYSSAIIDFKWFLSSQDTWRNGSIKSELKKDYDDKSLRLEITKSKLLYCFASNRTKDSIKLNPDNTNTLDEIKYLNKIDEMRNLKNRDENYILNNYKPLSDQKIKKIILDHFRSKYKHDNELGFVTTCTLNEDDKKKAKNLIEKNAEDEFNKASQNYKEKILLDYFNNVNKKVLNHLFMKIICNSKSNFHKNYYIREYIKSNHDALPDYSYKEAISDEKALYFNNLINNLDQIISIYLKIEWDIAKKGK